MMEVVAQEEHVPQEAELCEPSVTKATEALEGGASPPGGGYPQTVEATADAKDSTADEPPPPQACGKSMWTPEKLRETIQLLPASEMFPELAEQAAQILAQWYQRFPAKVWGRLVKIADSGTGRTQRIPKVLKEFNEAAPVLSRLLSWVSDSKAADREPMDIVDLCSGFGFLSMFASEILPADAVKCIYLVDRSWANRGVDPGPNSEHISNDHIYAHGEWPIPLLTLKLDITKGADVRGLARHVIGDTRPTILCGIHLCGTLSLRACQLFNDSVASGCGVIGLILAPCCLPRPQHRKRRFLYDVGGHRFAATELFEKVAIAGTGCLRPEGAYAAYTRHLFECLKIEDKTKEVIPIHRDTDRGGGQGAQNIFLTATAPFHHAGTALDTAEFGQPVVVEIDGKPRPPSVLEAAREEVVSP